jgi:hypothetical protein
MIMMILMIKMDDNIDNIDNMIHIFNDSMLNKKVSLTDARSSRHMDTSKIITMNITVSYVVDVYTYINPVPDLICLSSYS